MGLNNMFWGLASAVCVYAHVCVAAKGMLLHPSLYMGVGDPKLGPHLCSASILLTKPSRAHKHGILKLNWVWCLVPVVLSYRKQRQEDHEASLVCKTRKTLSQISGSRKVHPCYMCQFSCLWLLRNTWPRVFFIVWLSHAGFMCWWAFELLTLLDCYNVINMVYKIS